MGHESDMENLVAAARFDRFGEFLHGSVVRNLLKDTCLVEGVDDEDSGIVLADRELAAGIEDEILDNATRGLEERFSF